MNSLNYFNHHQTPPSFGPSLTSRSHHHLTMTPPHTPVRKSVSISPPPSAPPIVSSSQSAFSFPFSSPLPEESATPSSPPSQIIRCATSPVKVVSPHTQVRRSSDSDVSNITPPKGRSHHNTVNVLNLAVNSVFGRMRLLLNLVLHQMHCICLLGISLSLELHFTCTCM